MHKSFKYIKSTKAFKVFVFFIFILAIYDVTFAQGRRDIDGNKYVIYSGSDTLKFKFRDTTTSSNDTTKRAPVDSTARLKYYQYFPEYSYGSKIKEKTHPLLIGNSSYIKYEVVFDTNNTVLIKQTFQNQEIKASSRISLKQYLNLMGYYNDRRTLSDLYDEKYKGAVVDDLGKIFEKFTDITIPLPFKTETIFGPPTFNLKINGAIDITASYQNISSEQQLISTLTNNQNNINFKQDVQVTAKGTVGDKLTVDADWNTQRTFDFENQLKIKYTGYADEVIKSIEAGNVSLDTKSSLIQSTQALFGIKGEFKLGPLNIVTVVSQKKSKQEEKTYSGGSSDQNFSINVYDYSDNHYFIDTLYKTSFIDVVNHTSSQYTPTTIANQILVSDASFEVWVQTEISESNKRWAVAYVLLPPDSTNLYYDTLKRGEQVPGVKMFGFFKKLNPSDYYIDPFSGFISFKSNIYDYYHVGVTYRTFDGKKFGRGLTNVTASDTLVLKMIKCSNQNPVTTPEAWELKMKNVYRLPVSRVMEDGFKLEIKYNDNNNPTPSIPGSNKNIIEITGLDRYTGKGRTPPPDGAFDYLTSVTIIPETGDIVFPSLRPFYDNIQNAGFDSTFQFKDLYLKRKSEASISQLANKYVIMGSARGEAGITNTINLGFNVVQGSVKVKVGEQELKANIDYSIDYSTGVLVIRNASALSSQNLKITYETNDLFSLASKILIGARADYKFSEKTNLGFTFVNLKQETLNDKVRIGEEPTNNSVFGLDFSTEIKTNFLTKLVNLLPGYNTKEESNFRFKGEFAYLTPDPNTKKSAIPQDNNQSIAYIDDMEGAKKTIPLGSLFSQWTISSLPIDTVIGALPSYKQQYQRGRMKWYNIPNDVDVKKIYPLRDVQPGQDKLTPFYISFNPKQRGTYNYNGKMDTISSYKSNWNGIMRYLNTTSTDLINENINYIEFNMRVEYGQNPDLSGAYFVIDLGQISEDAIPNGILNTEDKNQNGTLQDDEDIGLDELTNQQELDFYNLKNFTSLTLTDLPDPALDDNIPGQVVNIDVLNGTQNNRGIEGGNRPDTEDLNRTSSLDASNSYFEYLIPLDTTNNKRISGRGEPGSGWFQYRIPITEFNKKFGDPSLNFVDFARIWIKGINDSIRVALVDVNLVGNQWMKADKNDTSYNIAVVSIEENPQIYQSPIAGDVLRQTVRNTTGVNTKSNEQSIAVQVNDLPTGGRKFAIRDYQMQTLDLFNYKIMKLFVNGDPSFSYVNENIYDAAMVIRFGNDSNNYYEYRAPIHPDVRPGQPWNSLNEVTIVFSDLTSLKLARDSVNEVVDMPVPNGPPGAYYRVKGNPTLNAIREFELGVEKNKTGLNASISGSVWFNEMRVLKVNDNKGYAMNINAGVKFADLGEVNFNFSKVDPNYHALDTRVGSRQTGQNWDINLSFNVHKLINNAFATWFGEEWKDFLNLPFTYRHQENIVKPDYYPGTDIDLDKAASQRYNQVLKKTNDPVLAEQAANEIRLEAQGLIVRNEFSVSGMAFRFPGNNYLLKTLVNSFAFNFNGSTQDQRDFTYKSKSDFQYSGLLNYKTDFGLSEFIHLNIGKFVNLGEEYKDAKLYFFLPFIPLAPLFSTDFNASIDFNRSRNEGRQRKLTLDDPVGRQFGANRGFQFNWKFIENWIIDLTGSYNFKVNSDLSGFETFGDSLNTLRSEKDVYNQIFFNEGLINFGKDLMYQQTNTIVPKFNIPIIKKFFDVTMNYNVTYQWGNPNTATNIGYNVGFANKLQTQANFRFNELFKLFKSSGDDEKTPEKFNSKLKRLSDDNPTLGDILNLLKTLLPESVSLSYSQDNSVANPGVQGRPGFGNFWMTATTKPEFGPSRFYQLGFSMYPGLRVPGLQIQDNYTQANNMTLSAKISPLVPQNISMNLQFKNNWGFQKTATFISDPQGIISNPTSSSNNTGKTYSIFFPGDIDKFSFEFANEASANTLNIANAFKDQVSSFPFPNWTMTISGVEKLPVFSEFASTVSVENSFTSEYSEAYSLDFTGNSIPQKMQVTQSFSPLIGINVTFKEAFGGNLSASLRINSSKSNILTPSSSLVQVTNTSDWSLTTNYAKSGFEIPFMGLSLKNDLTFSLTISKNTTNPLDYKYSLGTLEKVPGSGTAVTTINPSIQYSLSSKVQMQLFFKYVKTEPTQNTANMPPRTSKEGGLNIRILIQ